MPAPCFRFLALHDFHKGFQSSLFLKNLNRHILCCRGNGRDLLSFRQIHGAGGTGGNAQTAFLQAHDFVFRQILNPNDVQASEPCGEFFARHLGQGMNNSEFLFLGPVEKFPGFTILAVHVLFPEIGISAESLEGLVFSALDVFAKGSDLVFFLHAKSLFSPGPAAAVPDRLMGRIFDGALVVVNFIGGMIFLVKR